MLFTLVPPGVYLKTLKIRPWGSFLRKGKVSLFQATTALRPGNGVMNSDNAVLNSDNAVLNSDNAVLNPDKAVLNSDNSLS